jgi:hypothetical protein
MRHPERTILKISYAQPELLDVIGVFLLAIYSQSSTDGFYSPPPPPPPPQSKSFKLICNVNIE